MYKHQQGLTLLELLATMAIIGVLAALGAPAYQDYVIRAQVAEGVVMSRTVRDYLVDEHMESGNWPNNNNLADLANQNDIDGQYTKSVRVNQNQITLMFGNNAHSEIFHKKITFLIDYVDGRYTWSCAGHAQFPDRYLPRACQTIAAQAPGNGNDNGNGGGNDNGNGGGNGGGNGNSGG